MSNNPNSNPAQRRTLDRPLGNFPSIPPPPAAPAVTPQEVMQIQLAEQQMRAQLAARKEQAKMYVTVLAALETSHAAAMAAITNPMHPTSTVSLASMIAPMVLAKLVERRHADVQNTKAIEDLEHNLTELRKQKLALGLS